MFVGMASGEWVAAVIERKIARYAFQNLTKCSNTCKALHNQTKNIRIWFRRQTTHDWLYALWLSGARDWARSINTRALRPSPKPKTGCER
jgi:hypothetical protein